MSKPDTEDRRRALRPLAQLYPYLSRYRLRVAAALFFLVLAAATTLTLPLAVRRVIDKGFFENDPQLVNSYFAVLMLISLVLAVASASRYYFVIWLGERVVSDLRKDVFSNLTKLGAEFYDTARSGEIISRLTADTTQIKSAVGATASLALRNSILGLGALIMMMYTSPRLSLIVIGAIPLIVLPIVAFGRAVRRRARNAQDKLADATAYASEAVSSVRIMQAFTNGERVSQNFSDTVEYAFEAARLAIRTRAFLTAFAIILVFSSVVAVLWIGAWDVLENKLTPGTLGQFLLYAVFAAGAMAGLSEVWGELSQAAGSAERLTELLTEKPAIAAPENPSTLKEPVTGNIRFSSVSFNYPTRPGDRAIENVSFKINPGETVAVVGPSGAGKSTLFSLLLRFYDATKGKISIDGTEIKKLDPVELRQQFALVPQDSIIFATSAHNNIAYGNFEASRNEVVAATKAAYADEFINKLPDGYETELGERGVTLSGGQRQRLAIARAILKNAPILLLDEATSALDAHSEKLVQDALDHLMEGRTTLIIAHRLATILKADRILVMDQGRIAEEGTHKALISKKGIYASLAKLQFDTANITSN